MLTVGIDEAGRGSLAGPVVSAAVIIEEKIAGVNDSKSLTSDMREALFHLILNGAVSFGIGVASCKEIDRINILNATFLSMRRAIDSLFLNYRKRFGSELSDFMLLVDGNKKIKGIVYPQRAIISGDKIVYEISAASIVAKVTRDRIMESLSKKYPVYGFEQHKGYATKSHIEKIVEFGPSEIHRRTFLRRVMENEQKLFG